MAEKLGLVVPIVPPAVTDYEVGLLSLDRLRQIVYIEVYANTATVVAVKYTGAVAGTMIQQLNKANLSTKSLERRIIERLQLDGYLPAGTINGFPD